MNFDGTTSEKNIKLLVPESENNSDAEIEISIVVPALNEELTIGEFVDWCWEGLKKANKVIDVQQDINLLNKFWDVLTINLKNTHNSNPVHSIDEISELVRKFPENIELLCGLYQLEVVAGVIVFKTYNVWHVQYIASSELGNANSALDAVFQKIISSAKDNEVRYFDFGTSNENEGKILNNGLYKFKTELKC